MLIDRSQGDATPVRILIKDDDPRLDAATTVDLVVYDDQQKSTEIETISAAAASYGPVVVFAPINADWSGTRYAQLVFRIPSGDFPLKELITWKQS